MPATAGRDREQAVPGLHVGARSRRSDPSADDDRGRVARWPSHDWHRQLAPPTPRRSSRLSQYRQSIDDLKAIPITILSVTGAQVLRAADFSHQYGLLTNDALIIAVMQDHGLTHLASNDADFDRVPGLTRYAPT